MLIVWSEEVTILVGFLWIQYKMLPKMLQEKTHTEVIQFKKPLHDSHNPMASVQNLHLEIRIHVYES